MAHQTPSKKPTNSRELANPQNSTNSKKPSNLKEFLAQSVIIRNHARDERLNYLESVHKANFCAMCNSNVYHTFRKCACGRVYCRDHYTSVFCTFDYGGATPQYCCKCHPDLIQICETCKKHVVQYHTCKECLVKNCETCSLGYDICCKCYITHGDSKN